jgi:dihydroflavonol-4-reductase
VLQEETLQQAMSQVEHVYHLAGLISILPGKDRRLEMVNIHGTQNVVQVALQAGVKRLVYTSSIHAIRRMPTGVVIDENIPFDPVNALSSYDRSKAIATLSVQAAVCQGLDAVIACPTGVIGPYDYRHSEMGRLIQDCMLHKPQFYVDGAYDFVDVRDVAEGLVQVCEHGRTGQAYILSGEQISVRSLLETVRDVSGSKIKLLRLPMWLARFAAVFTPLASRLFSARPRFTSYSLETLESNSIISHARARNELGYAPRSLRHSLTDTVRWLRQIQETQAVHALIGPIVRRRRTRYEPVVGCAS